jgi:hypothetical protein
MLYSGMFPVTMAADREARPPGRALAAAAARLGTPVCFLPAIASFPHGHLRGHLTARHGTFPGGMPHRGLSPGNEGVPS